MLVLGLDFEATGVKPAEDCITEIGAVLWDTDTQMPLRLFSTFINTPKSMTEEAARVTGLTEAVLNKYGVPITSALADLEALSKEAEVIVAHNGNSYDKPLLISELTRNGLLEASTIHTKHWIDTKDDLPHPRAPESNKLNHLALDAGFINPFKHRALFDVLTMLLVMHKYPYQAVLDSSKLPMIVVRAIVDYDHRELAKEHRFSWEKLGDLVFPKMWVKRIKINKLDELKAACKFNVVRIK